MPTAPLPRFDHSHPSFLNSPWPTSSAGFHTCPFDLKNAPSKLFSWLIPHILWIDLLHPGSSLNNLHLLSLYPSCYTFDFPISLSIYLVLLDTDLPAGSGSILVYWFISAFETSLVAQQIPAFYSLSIGLVKDLAIGCYTSRFISSRKPCTVYQNIQNHSV